MYDVPNLWLIILYLGYVLCVWTLMISNCAESKDLPFTTLFIIKLKGIVLSPSQVQPLESNMDDLKTGVFQN
jgi:hypothetical protein